MKLSKSKKKVLFLLIIICVILAFVSLWLNTYIIHHVIFSVFNYPKHINLSRGDGNEKTWMCNEENITFVAVDFIRPDPNYLEMEIANGRLVTQDGETVDFHIEFESESFYFTMYIGEDEYYGMGRYDYKDSNEEIYTLIFNNKNWPDEYFDGENRKLVFVAES